MKGGHLTYFKTLMILVFPVLAALSTNELIKEIVRKQNPDDRRTGFFIYSMIAIIITFILFCCVKYNGNGNHHHV
jgi:membrane-anchored glycerophosphoryl diester phosphodiesterase (GDPDase)